MINGILTLVVLAVGIPLLILFDRDAQLDNMMSPEWVARQAREESMLRHPAGKGKP